MRFVLLLLLALPLMGQTFTVADCTTINDAVNSDDLTDVVSPATRSEIRITSGSSSSAWFNSNEGEGCVWTAAQLEDSDVVTAYDVFADDDSASDPPTLTDIDGTFRFGFLLVREAADTDHWEFLAVGQRDTIVTIEVKRTDQGLSSTTDVGAIGQSYADLRATADSNGNLTWEYNLGQGGGWVDANMSARGGTPIDCTAGCDIIVGGYAFETISGGEEFRAGLYGFEHTDADATGPTVPLSGGLRLTGNVRVIP